MNEDLAPYECLHCGNKVGLSWIESKHNCNKPFFNKDVSITQEFKNIHGNKMA